MGEEHLVQYCNEPANDSVESTNHIWCWKSGCRHSTQRKKNLLYVSVNSSFCSVLRELEQPRVQHNSHAFPNKKNGLIKLKELILLSVQCLNKHFHHKKILCSVPCNTKNRTNLGKDIRSAFLF